MQRNDYLMNLASISISKMAKGTVSIPSASANVKLPENNAFFLLSSFIAGFRYYEGPKLGNRIGIGTRLEFRLSRDNHYDSNAVEIYYRHHKLGHVPRIENKTIASLLRQGYRLNGIVKGKADLFNYFGFEYDVWTV